MATFQDYLQAILGLTQGQAGAPRSLNPQTLGQPAVTNQPPVSDPDAAYRAAIGISPETPGVFDKEFWQPGSPTNRAFSGALANAGMNLLNGGRQSPLQSVGNLLAGTSGGFNQNLEQQEALAANRAWRQAQMGKVEADMRQQDAQRLALEEAIAYLPKEQQAMARANPDAFLKPQDAELKQVYDPANNSMVWVNEAEATGRPSALPVDIEAQLRRAGAASVNVKSEGAIPPGYQLIRDKEGRPLRLEAIAGGPLTEGQSTGTLQFSMAQHANALLDNVDTVLTSPGDYVASQFGTPGNYLKSDEYRQAEQAALVLSEQHLRALTGAAAPEPEVKRTARSMLPQPGDDAGTIAQKRATRAQIIDALRIKAGPGAAQVQPPGASSAPPASGPADVQWIWKNGQLVPAR